MVQWTADKAAIGLLVLAVAGWYIASRAAAEALARGRRSPGRQALGHWLVCVPLPIAAIVASRPEIAVGAIFASSVACLTLALGIITIAAPQTQPTLPRRTWLFILPASLIALLIGFSGGLRWIHALILVLEGFALLHLWNDPSPPVPLPPAEPPSVTPSAHARITPALLLSAALLAGIVAAWAGVSAAGDLSAHLGLPSAGLATALMIGPALVLSFIGWGSQEATQGHYDQAVDALLGFVLLNLCALLPLTTALYLTRPHWQPPIYSFAAHGFSARSAPTTAPATDPADKPPQAMPYPMAVWRVDTVLLVAVGLLLVPVSLGRWTLGRLEGYALLLTYLIYMILTAAMAR